MSRQVTASVRLKTQLILLVLAALALFISGCGGGSGFTTPLPNNGGSLPGNNNNGGNTGGGDPTINLPGGGQGHPFAFVPSITVPPVETYRASSGAGDSLETAWLKNCFETSAASSGINGCYQNASLKSWADIIFAGVNEERVKLGLSPVKRNTHLDEVSQAMARDMALRNYFAHETPEGLTPWDRYEAIEIPPYNRAGEISAKGQESCAEVVAGWMASPGHRAIIAMSELTHGGIGVYFDDSDYTQPIHVVMDFAQFPKVDPDSVDWYRRGSVWSGN